MLFFHEVEILDLEIIYLNIQIFLLLMYDLFFLTLQLMDKPKKFDYPRFISFLINLIISSILFSNLL